MLLAFSDVPAVAPRRVTIELLALDLAACGRCARTAANLDAAVATVTKRLRRAGVAVDVRKTVVRTAEQAVALRFASSPTIRVDGRDLALETRESACDDCGALCHDTVECRVWVWGGRAYEEAPEAMIVEAVLRAADGPSSGPPDAPSPYSLPDNLRRFFDAKARATPPPSAGSCCGGGACRGG
jgi:hypothetical protein